MISVALCNDLIDYCMFWTSVQYNACSLKSSLIYGSWWDGSRFMKNIRFNTICNITQEPQELQRYNRACRFIGKSTVIKCHQVLSKVTSIKQEIAFRPVSNRPLVSASLISHDNISNVFLLACWLAECCYDVTTRGRRARENWIIQL